MNCSTGAASLNTQFTVTVAQVPSSLATSSLSVPDAPAVLSAQTVNPMEAFCEEPTAATGASGVRCTP
ncbi:MAG: hypothetical protein BWY79_01813 [Actinobacteria bacterium ADurb.Bin444]|nr:MAG: hypothetical protein BWY79_01813 [Actinobacteria bacterium ADurb.Bin444]